MEGNRVFRRLLPETIDNRFRGHRFALWLFFPIALVTLVRSCIHIFRFDGGAQSIATIPLDRFTSEGSAAVITIFALWGLSQLVIGLLYVLVLLRYRALISLMYLLLLVEYVGRIGIGAIKPIATLETPPGAVFNFWMILLSLICLILSLRWNGEFPTGVQPAARS
jgi:hypothetical protein